MLKRCSIALVSVLIAGRLFAQDVQDLDRRLKALEEKIRQIQQTSETAELQREIDVLTREIESLKSGQQRKAVEATTSQYGLGAAASKVYRSQPGVAFGGYGEFVYQNFRSGETATADWVRAVLYAGYKFSDRVIFNSETEVEHANLEHGGNVEMEFGYLDFLVKPQFNVRTGLMLMPVGLVNELHEPTAYFGARRPVVDDRIIPTTWSELGAGAFGDVGRVSYRAYLVTGLHASRFGAEEGIRQGRQGGAEAAAEDWAAVGRADWHPFEGTMLGGSLYGGNSGQGAGFSARVTLGEIHAESKFRGLTLRSIYARGTIGDAARVNEANALSGDQSVGKSFGGWYVEGGYDVASLLQRGDYSLTPFARYERFDTQRSVPAGFERNSENNGRILTLGVGYKPISQTVIKVDWQKVNNRARTGMDQFNIAVGYIF
jgi:cell division protein FtsB